MARFVDAKCKQCRTEGEKLFLKGARCETVKCPISKRERRPGMHGWKRTKSSEYSIRLRAKQKLKKTYGVLEAQFRCYYQLADQKRGNTGENLICVLESRLDNVLYRLGFAQSIAQARQLINHGHVTVNDRKVDIASFRVKKSDVIKPVAKEKSEKLFKENYDDIGAAKKPSWLNIVEKPLHGEVLADPSRDEIRVTVEEQLIVELCSR